MNESRSAGAASPGTRRVHLPATVLAALLEQARAAAPAECCGALLGPGAGAAELHLARALALPNDEADPKRYRIGPELVRAAEAQAALLGLEVVGFYHSHPGVGAKAKAGALPSVTDLAMAWPWYSYLIIDAAGRARAWRLLEDRSGFEEEVLVVGGEAAT